MNKAAIPRRGKALVLEYLAFQERKGLNQDEAADALGSTRQSLWRYTVKTPPSKTVCLAIHAVMGLKVPPNY